MADENDKEQEKPKPKHSLRRGVQDEVIEVEVGVEKKFQLVEMSGLERDMYQDSQQKRLVWGNDGKPVRLNTTVHAMADLICRCLTDVEGYFGDPGKLVPLEKVKDFPSSLQDYLFEECRKLNKLEEKAKEAAKKD